MADQAVESSIALWWLVTPGQSALRITADCMISMERADAARKMANDPRIDISCSRIRHWNPDYQLPTPSAISAPACFPACALSGSWGADNLAQFHRWQNWRAHRL